MTVMWYRNKTAGTGSSTRSTETDGSVALRQSSSARSQRCTKVCSLSQTPPATPPTTATQGSLLCARLSE